MTERVFDSLIVHAQVATIAGSAPHCGSAMREIGLLNDAAVGIIDGNIAFVGSSQDAAALEAKERLDARGRLLTPGLVDPHTHLVHSGSRENELAQKLAGIPYLEILQQGGGILSTVHATRRASREELIEQALRSLRTMLLWGTTTVEAKSGYGLDVPTELLQLRVAQELRKLQPVEIISTFLGPHAIPPEYQDRPDAFLEQMIQLLPAIQAEQLADFADIFCEHGVFSVVQSERFLEAAQKAGFGLKIHADEVEPLGGAELAAKLGAVSADHLLAASENGLRSLVSAGVMPVLLPGTSWNLRAKPARARFLIDTLQAPVALATDYNPGSCPTESLQFIMALAANELRMTPEEILTAVTINSAHAIRQAHRVGSIEVGKQADLCLFNADNPAYLVYHFGINHIADVWKKGQHVVVNGLYIDHP